MGPIKSPGGVNVCDLTYLVVTKIESFRFGQCILVKARLGFPNIFSVNLGERVSS